MIFLVYSLLLGFIIPFTTFIFPYIFNLFIDKDMFPIDIVLNILIPIIISFIIFLYHRQNTQIACETSNNVKAAINASIVFIIMLVWMMSLDYFPGIISPFLQLTSTDNAMVVFISKFIMIYALVFLLLTYTSFSSIGETCKINIKEMKEVYKKMENSLK
jgi:hypothetical protein